MNKKNYTTQSHDSIWFAQPTNYSENIQEDKKLRWKKKKNRPFEYSKFNEKIIEVGA